MTEINHRSTGWRHRQIEAVNDRVVEAFIEATESQQTQVATPTTNQIVASFPHDDSGIDMTLIYDRKAESPIANNSENIKTSEEQNRAVSMLESVTLTDEQFDPSINSVHIATSLIALKFRHKLSQRCIEDILTLLSILGIRVPSSYEKLCTVLRKRSAAHLSPSLHTICPHCQNISDEASRCTACAASYSPISPSEIPLFYKYNITKQIESILSTSPDLILHDKNSLRKPGMSNITDGNVYNNLLDKGLGACITLTMNVDGIQTNKGSDQSIWPVLLVVNEIKKRKRYSPENTIIAGIWPGPSKPSRTEMSLFLKDIVSELQDLEKNRVFELYSIEEEPRYESLKVFLIAACCDKPAQSLLQFLPDPTAFFGCGNCEIEGVSVFTKNDGSVVSFAISEGDQSICKRTNERHHLLLEQQRKNKFELSSFSGNRGRRALIQMHKQTEKGIKGPCILRNLSYFDVGRSFLMDSLHNIYLGLFRRLLSLWLNHQDKEEDWSVYSRMDELSNLLGRIRFPSTTTRHPRSLKKFAKYKGSELRLVLLFGYSVFENILRPKYYSHILLLVLAVHNAEFRCLTHDMVDTVGKLCREFLYQFPKLYSPRHNVQVVHSILHLSETLSNFGPLFTYSTFNFEDQLGMRIIIVIACHSMFQLEGILTRTSKSTRRHAIEIMNNLTYLRDACFEIMKPGMNKELHKLISQWLHLSHCSNNPSIQSVHAMHQITTTDRTLNSIFPGNITYYSSAIKGRLRLTTFDYARNKVADDSSIFFRSGAEESFGRIRRIFTIDNSEPIFYVDVPSQLELFTCTTIADTYSYAHIRTGLLDDNVNSIFISGHDIIEKCVFYERPNRICTFYRFLNLEECS